MPLILTDIDETLLNYIRPFRQWMEDKGHKPVLPYESVYDLGLIFGLEEDVIIQCIADFCYTPEFKALPALDCSKQILPRLHNEGFRFVAITATVDSPEVREIRLRNLSDQFGFEFEDCFCTGLRLPKTPFLEKYKGKNEFWVEDNFQHAADGASMGHKTFLLNRDYNNSFEHGAIHRIDDWHEIADLYL